MNKPPQSIETETAILGACLQSEKATLTAIQEMQEDDFYSAQHREIFKAICSVHSSGQAVDMLTVANAIVSTGGVQNAGGLAYVSGLTDQILMPGHIKAHCKIVKAAATARKAIELSSRLSMACYDGMDPVVAIESFAHEITSLNRGVKFDPVAVSEITAGVVSRIGRIVAGTECYGIQTGFVDIDKRLVGLAPADLVIVAARPSMGKTTFAMNVASNVAASGKRVLVFSLEMTKEQIITREISARSMISGESIRKGNLSDGQLRKISLVAESINKLPMIICDKAGLTISQLQSVAKFEHIKHKIDMVVVDYMQLVTASIGKNGNREQEISTISRGLKALAKDLGCPIVVLSQLNRGLEGRSDKRPIMSDLRESGAIEQDADVIMFLYRDEVYNKESPLQGIAEVITRKQRNGPTGEDQLRFSGDFFRFDSLSMVNQ